MESDDNARSVSPATGTPVTAARVDGTLKLLRSLSDHTPSGPDRAVLIAAVTALEDWLAGEADGETRYRTLMDAVPDAVTLHDEVGNILDANLAATRIYGYPLDVLCRMNVHDLNPSLPADHMQRLEAVFAHGKTLIDQQFNRHADGHRFPIEVHSNAYHDKGRYRIIAVARDISDRKHAEERLQVSEARYLKLFQAMDKGVVVQDEHGMIVSANPAACRMLGMTECELTALTAEDVAGWHVVTADGQPMNLRDLPGNLALRTRRSVNSTVYGVYLPHLHEYRWISVTAVADVDPTSKRTRQVISNFTDVTALKRGEQMFRTTQRLGQIGCWELDDLRGTLFWTEYMFTIHDLPPTSPINESRASSFLTPEGRRLFAPALEAVRNHGTRFELELEIITAIGRHRWIRVRGKPLERHGRIYGVIGTVQDIDARRAAEAQLREQANTDALTGLANRTAMLAAIEATLANAGAAAAPAVLYIDPDRFKVLNDMLGHQDGDRLLQAAAKRLVATVGDDGRVGRYGNDEFVVLLENCASRHEADALAGRIVDAFAPPFELDGSRFAMTVSVGVACWPGDGTDAHILLLHADGAMGEAKRRGRNTWHSWGSTGHDGESDRHRLEIEAQLRLALDNHEFQLAYQPQVDLATGRVTGAEALLRWNSTVLGPQSPSLFIPYAESTGDVVRIGAWVIDEACRQLRMWLDQGLALPRLSVNVSYRQVLSGHLLSTLQKALADNHLPGDTLELEMTERVLIENASDTQETFRQLKRLGVSLVIDDFGEGFSSLNYLRHLPLDGLKISHTFMAGVPDEATDTAICDAIVHIAHSLGLRIIAEGVETVTQRRFLQDRQAAMAQGYLFARPQPASAIPACVARINAAGTRSATA